LLVLLPTTNSGADLILKDLQIEGDQCLFKPISSSELIKYAQRYLESPRASEIKLVEEASRNSSLRILIVDDSEVNREIAAGFLELFGHTFEMATNGEEAVEAVRHSAFDAIFMDIEMPILDGFAAARQIRSLPGEASAVPILAMTAHALTGIDEQCREAGMNGCLTKPIQLDRLQAAVEQIAEGSLGTLHELTV
jgi:CheY-like chemotaxis protein